MPLLVPYKRDVPPPPPVNLYEPAPGRDWGGEAVGAGIYMPAGYSGYTFVGRVFLDLEAARLAEKNKRFKPDKQLPASADLSETEKLRRDIEELKAAQRRIAFPVDAPERKKEPEPPPMKVFSHGIPVY